MPPVLCIWVLCRLCNVAEVNSESVRLPTMSNSLVRQYLPGDFTPGSFTQHNMGLTFRVWKNIQHLVFKAMGKKILFSALSLQISSNKITGSVKYVFVNKVV